MREVRGELSCFAVDWRLRGGKGDVQPAMFVFAASVPIGSFGKNQR